MYIYFTLRKKAVQIHFALTPISLKGYNREQSETNQIAEE